MKFLKTFESYSEPTDDMIIIEEIYDEELYRSEISLKRSIDKMSDKKFALGLLMDLLIRQEGVDKNVIFELMSELSEDESEVEEAHEYFVNKFNSDVRVAAFRFFEMEGDISKNEKFIDWIKSLSDLDTQRLINLALELEVYELIPFIKELRSFS